MYDGQPPDWSGPDRAGSDRTEPGRTGAHLINEMSSGVVRPTYVGGDRASLLLPLLVVLILGALD